ncbi:SDR family NAD(P)-dependent oxidoreductase [Paracoccus shanxieyensis]|uniref:SDR family oxidoreductase n=1 Tax=Paracoccus shanxieyensis TaxID=2675752 RepID=A0A6L6IUK5_9RHOB|nr:SDR family oxidoreductase [Paracoccus shanxieyensis]MTH64225.1 SDR family oxidoreductase [Paracoccus shanxieyensis]MTH87369.1 SDR family oxidoreductase [Paracoccus shanxieyensis]
MKIAIITGGSRGLGRNAALHLAKAGHGVVLTYRGNADAAAEVVAQIRAQGGTAHALPLDTAQIAGFAQFAQDLRAALKDIFGRDSFDYLLNNAGYGIHKPFAETTEADFDGLVDVHLKGVFFLTQTLLPLLADGGRILNVSTGLARFSLPGYAAYASVKGGVEVLSRYLAKELGPRGIAVNTIAPGAIETDFGGGGVRDLPEVNRMIAASTAMGRAGLPDDIGAAVAAILAPENGWMTGQRIEVSGGQNL